MTQDEIIRMAREAGFCGPAPTDGYMGVAFDRRGGTDSGGSLKRFFDMAFAAGVAHEREKQLEHFAKAIAELVECCRVLAEDNEAAVLAEREACAKVCDEQFQKYGCVADKCAAAIRARSDK